MVFSRTWRSKPLEYLGEYYLNLYDVDKGYFHVYKEGRTFFLYPEELNENEPFMDFDKQERSYSIKVLQKGQPLVYRWLTFVKMINNEDDAGYIVDTLDKYKEEVVKTGKGYLRSNIGKMIGGNLYVIISYANLSYLDSEMASHEDHILNTCSSCVKSYGVYSIYNPPIEEMETSTAIIREDYLRLGRIVNILSVNEMREIAFKFGSAIYRLIDDGIGHVSPHEDNVVVKKDNDEFIVKLTDGSEMYKLDEGNIRFLIIDRKDGIRTTIGNSILSTIRLMSFYDKEKLVVDEFLKGLDVYDDKIAKEIKKRIDYMGNKEIEIAGKICEKIVKEYFV